MNDVSLPTLFFILFVLILLSGFFSGSETALMALDRYRLRHQADKGNKSAQRTINLLAKPDQLISLILLGNNFINILITQLATYIGFRLSGEAGVAIATGVLTILLLIFAEVAPKTLGVMRSEMLAHPATLVYYWMLRFPPLAWVVKLINWLAGGVLKILRLRIDTNQSNTGELSTEELRTVVTQTRTLISNHHQDMLLRILDIENATVEDIMIPRSEIVGIDLDDEWEDIETLIRNTTFTRLPVYKTNIDNILGFIHIRSIMKLMVNDGLNKESIQTRLRPPLFIPENTSLPQQLLNFQKEHRRHGLVVDEYGDIQGLVALEEILEEIVGEFTNLGFNSEEVHPQQDGSYIIDGGIHVRELKQLFGWEIEKKGPKTLNGLILEYLESIPKSGTTMLINQHPVEVLKVQYNAVQTAKVYPKYERPDS